MIYKIHPKIIKQIMAIKIYGPYQYFATVTFQYLLNEVEAVTYASTIIRRCNKKLLGKRYDKKNAIKGYAILEKAKITSNLKKADRSNCHFHFLFKEHPSLQGDPQKLLERFESGFRSAALGLNLNKSSRLVSKEGTNVQRVYSDRIYEYVTKDAWHPAWEQHERLFLLDCDGLV